MRISRVRIRNYRNLRDIDVELGSLVTLIGENNSGKTNLLHAISIPFTQDNNTGTSKRLSWYDINKEAKKEYYDFLTKNRSSIIDDSLSLDEFRNVIPTVYIQLTIKSEDNEHYDVNDILFEDEDWNGGILYEFFIKNPKDLLDRVRKILTDETNFDNIPMSLLPMELYDYSITVPGKGNKISYDTLSRFHCVDFSAERDSFSSNADRLGAKALSDLLRGRMNSESLVRIEKSYQEFFDTVKTEGNLDQVLNWHNYSDIENAQDFFKQINILPNMPQMNSILGGIKLGYDDENMCLQGLGHRNLILLSVLMNAYINKKRDISFRLMTIEEPEAHLCISNILLMISLIKVFSQNNRYTQIIYSTHNAEFVNKIGLDKVVILHDGKALSLKTELSDEERKYLAINPNSDIFKLLYSKKTILVEGITEELLIKSYLQTRENLNDIKVLSFHKGFTRIIDIWKKINTGTGNKLGIVRDNDDQPKAKQDHEMRESNNIRVRTTEEYTLETDIVKSNYELLKTRYGEEYGWSEMSEDQIQTDWRNNKTDVMFRICEDLISGELNCFVMPSHIQEIINFMQGV